MENSESVPASSEIGKKPPSWLVNIAFLAAILGIAAVVSGVLWLFFDDGRLAFVHEGETFVLSDFRLASAEQIVRFGATSEPVPRRSVAGWDYNCKLLKRQSVQLFKKFVGDGAVVVEYAASGDAAEKYGFSECPDHTLILLDARDYLFMRGASVDAFGVTSKVDDLRKQFNKK